MSLTINHNLMAQNAARNFATAYQGLSTSVRRLSSGLRIGTAADDAAGLAVSELMRADIATLNQGIRNTVDAVSLVQTADGALQVIDEKLIRMKELAEQAATGTYNSDQRQIMHSEFSAMRSEINRIAEATDFNRIKVLDGTVVEDMEAAGWESAAPAGMDGSYRDLSVTGVFNGKLYAVGDDGSSAALFEYDDETDSWNQLGEQGMGHDFTAPTEIVGYNGRLYIAGRRNGDSALLRYDGNGSFSNVTGPDLAGIGGAIDALEVQDGQLRVASASSIYSYDGSTWNQIDTTALGPASLFSLQTFDGDLYAGTGGARLWRYDGSSWTQIGQNGIDGDGNNVILSSMTVQNGALYLGTRNDGTGGEVWQYKDGQLTQVNQDGFGDAANGVVSSLGGYHGRVYAAVNRNDGLRVYEYDGSQWRLTNDPGFGNTTDQSAGNFTSYKDELYMGYLDNAGNPAGIYKNSTEGELKIHFGTGNDSAEDYYYINLGNATAKGLNLDTLWINTQENAQNVLDVLTDSIVTKDKLRAHLGSMQNRLENTAENLSIQAENLQSSESRIRDADMAAEMTVFIKRQIISQSAIAMLAQANSLPRMALQLITG